MIFRRLGAMIAGALLPLGCAHAQTVIVDNVAPDFTTQGLGSWPVSANSTPYGTNSQTNTTVSGNDRAIWRPTLPLSGVYDVSAWWVEGSNRANNAPYTVAHRNGSTIVTKARSSLRRRVRSVHRVHPVHRRAHARAARSTSSATSGGMPSRIG